jgi:2-polyprenyl-3-methyl-5-hydroxy-6-metoxy-1,4-benzoquinol methylase
MTSDTSSITSEQYQQLWNPDLDGGYPANHFAFRQVLNVLHGEDARSMIEIGVGLGKALPIFTAAGIEMYGVDNNPEMVQTSIAAMEALGLPGNRVTWGDIEDSVSLSGIRREGPFDALLAMGVLPHVDHERVALENMRHLVKPGGSVFVECRNKLFSLVTFNRFTYEFIMDDLLAGVSGEVRDTAGDFLKTRVDVEVPPKPTGHEAKYHNPLEIHEVFEDAGFIDIRVRPFHYHAAMPRFEKELGAAFRAESIALENEPSGWRGLFLCSAFVVEAHRPSDDW